MTAQAAETGILSEAVVYAASFSNGRLTVVHPAHRTRLLLQPALPPPSLPPLPLTPLPPSHLKRPLTCFRVSAAALAF
jgi:hypothetical protein